MDGDAFADLAAHDSHGNGWIDEADPVFTRPRLWSSPDAALQTLAGIHQVDVVSRPVPPSGADRPRHEAPRRRMGDSNPRGC